MSTRPAETENRLHAKRCRLPIGPVIGPMVICAFACPHGDECGLRGDGVKDSKLLTPQQRETLAKTIKKYPRSLVVLTAADLTQSMSKRTSLNEIEARAMAKAISEVVKKVGARNVKTIYVDTPDPTAAKYAARLRKYFSFPKQATLVCEHKADVNYPVVGAASILAKVTRDFEIEEIKRKLGHDFGNGYSHDERTIAFLKKHIRDEALQEFIRHKWITAKRMKTTQLDLSGFA
ncbi:MAG: ribonuclease HII [Candidatus Micrarchaeota archaeon]